MNYSETPKARKILILSLAVLLNGCAFYAVPVSGGVLVQPVPLCRNLIVPIYDAWGNLVGRRLVC